MAEGSTGEDWTRAQVETCVDAYFEHLRLDLQKRQFNKAQLYRELAPRIGRSPSSVEFKFQNISAVLNELGREWITGLAPLGNFQKMLADVVEERIRLGRDDDLPLPRPAFDDLAALYVEPPPERTAKRKELPDYMQELVRKFDPVERDMRNRELGHAGEELVLRYEQRFLVGCDRPDLAKNVRWISKEEGDGAGYDILSFDPNGGKRFIEVKTTVGGNRTPFFVSRNEHQFAERNADNFCLFRVFNFRKEPRAFELNGPLARFVRLSTESYRADFQA